MMEGLYGGRGYLGEGRKFGECMRSSRGLRERIREDGEKD